VRGVLWLQKGQDLAEPDVTGAMSGYITAHVLCLTMASALAHHDYVLAAQVGAIEEQLHVAEGAALSQEHFNSLLDLLQTCSNRARTMEQEENDAEAVQDRPLREMGITVALLDMYTLCQFRPMILRILQEDPNALSLSATQIATCIDAWMSTVEAQTKVGMRDTKKLPPSDELEAAVATMGDGAAELWGTLCRHPDVRPKISFRRHSGWVQVETRWNWAAKNFIIDHGRLGQAEVGQEDPSEDDSAWSAPLSNYYAMDGGKHQDDPPLWRIDLKPTKDGYPDFTFCAKKLEEQTDWLQKLNRHCAQPRKAKVSRKPET